MRDWGGRSEETGIDLMVIATGAYGDRSFKRHRWRPRAGRGWVRRRVRSPASTAAGHASRAEPREVCADRRRMRAAPAETDFDLPSIKEADGHLLQTPWPMPAGLSENANLAVTVALCGAGSQDRDRAGGRSTLPEGTNASRLEVLATPGDSRWNAWAARAGQPQDRADRVTMAKTMKMVRASDW